MTRKIARKNTVSDDSLADEAFQWPVSPTTIDPAKPKTITIEYAMNIVRIRVRSATPNTNPAASDLYELDVR